MKPMKRSIYVGETLTGANGGFLSYGMTGHHSHDPTEGTVFLGEGSRSIWSGLSRRDVYVPSEHKTRHCPKP
jgi:hypothetical protein